MHRSFNSLRFRLILLVLVSTLPALGLALMSGFEQRRVAAQTAQENAIRIARLAATNERELVNNAHQLLSILAEIPEIRFAHEDECAPLLQSLNRAYPNYLGLSVISTSGDILCTSYELAQPYNVADRPYFQRTLETGEFVIGDYTINRATEQAILPFAYPALDNEGQIVSVLTASLDLDWLNRLVPDVQLPEDSALMLLDRDGTILARHPEPELWVGRNLPEAPIIQAVVGQQAEGATETEGVDGVMRLYAFTRLQEEETGGGYVTVGIPTRVAFAAANLSLTRNLVGLGIVVFLALVVATYTSEVFILRQVRALITATARLSAGDLNARTGVAQGDGELNRLALAFDQMARTLQEREAQLVQAEARYRFLVEQIPAITYTADLDTPGNMSYISPQVQAILGFTPREWLDDTQTWVRQVHPEDCRRVLEELDRARSDGEPFKSEYRMHTRDGNVLWMQDEAVVVHDHANRPLFRQGILVDITQRKQAEVDLQEYSIQLERSNRELQDFAYIASHDLQEPLRKIQAFGERLVTKYSHRLGEEGQDYVNRMRNSAARMQVLINDLLSYSRVTTKARPHIPTDLQIVGQNVLANLETLIEETGGQVEIGKLPIIQADPVHMEQLLQNLVANSLKFHRPGTPPLVKVYAEPVKDGKKNNYINILVEDNGIGFNEKYLERIFQPFQRLHSRDQYSGSGIGLAICRKIVERHKGSLTATSQPGQGATFRISLPFKYTTEGEEQG